MIISGTSTYFNSGFGSLTRGELVSLRLHNNVCRYMKRYLCGEDIGGTNTRLWRVLEEVWILPKFQKKKPNLQTNIKLSVLEEVLISTKFLKTCQVTSADHMINLYGPTVIANTISKEELADTTVIINEPEKGEENYGFVETELSRDDNEDENLVLHRWQAARENVTSLQALAINSTNTSRKNSMILSRKSSMTSNTSKVTKVDMDEQGREDELSGLITAAVKARRESRQWSLLKDGDEAMQALLIEKQNSTKQMWTKILDAQRAEVSEKMLLDKGEVMRDLYMKTSVLKAMKRRRESEAPPR